MLHQFGIPFRFPEPECGRLQLPTGAVDIRYQLDGVAGSWTVVGGVGTSAYTPGSALTEGSHTLYVQAMDGAGNWSASGSKAIVIVITGSSGITLSGGLLGDYSVTFTVSGAAGIPAPDISGLYPVFTVTQNALPITLSASSAPSAQTFRWLLNGVQQSSASSSIQLSSLGIQNHYLTLLLKKESDPFRSATIILKVTY